MLTKYCTACHEGDKQCQRMDSQLKLGTVLPASVCSCVNPVIQGSDNISAFLFDTHINYTSVQDHVQREERED
jgi:hypothetical protein